MNSFKGRAYLEVALIFFLLLVIFQLLACYTYYHFEPRSEEGIHLFKDPCGTRLPLVGISTYST